MKSIIFALSFSLLGSSIFAQTGDEKRLERALFDLPDVSFSKISNPGELPLKYNLRVRQPLDHASPEKGSFYQLVQLTHHGFDRPTMMQTQGYQIFLGKSELELMLDANHLNIEHRYFGESKPDSMDWKYLTLEQVTADLHHVNQLFRNIYKGKWVSTGISKGGQTTIFYRYFYPNDVDVSIPYVAPFNNGLEDKRIYDFLDTVGSAECRAKIFDLQTFLLQHEDEALERLKWFSKGANLTYDYLGDPGKAFEYAVLEYSFSFWQWGHSCAEIPTNANLDDYLDNFLNVSDLGFFSDRDMKGYESHYYQAATQMGYYGYDIEPFKKHLRHFKQNPLASFPPKVPNLPKYDNSLNEKVDKWLKTQGNNFIYIYGGSDTWSADAVFPSSKVNAKTFVLPGKDHGKARIKNMTPAMQDELASLLKQWTGLDMNFQAAK